MCVYGPSMFQGRKHMKMVLNHNLNSDLEAEKVEQQVRMITLVFWGLKLDDFGPKSLIEERG